MSSSKEEKALTAHISAVQSKLGLVRNNVVRFDSSSTKELANNLEDIEELVDQCIRISEIKKEGRQLWRK